MSLGLIDWLDVHRQSRWLHAEPGFVHSRWNARENESGETVPLGRATAGFGRLLCLTLFIFETCRRAGCLKVHARCRLHKTREVVFNVPLCGICSLPWRRTIDSCVKITSYIQIKPARHTAFAGTYHATKSVVLDWVSSQESLLAYPFEVSSLVPTILLSQARASRRPALSPLKS